MEMKRWLVKENVHAVTDSPLELRESQDSLRSLSEQMVNSELKWELSCLIALPCERLTAFIFAKWSLTDVM